MIDDFADVLQLVEKLPPAPPTAPHVELTECDDDFDFDSINIEPRDGVASITLPWMQYHRFDLVQTAEQVKQIVDDAIAHGRCALDLETEGLDNRIDFDADGKPHTKHKIVGYCISIKGHGYYIPLRHDYDTFSNETNPNVDSIEKTEAEINRLCWASQPVLTKEGLEKDPLASKDMAVPPKVVIYFYHAKFDQEFLYPVTGIDFWHPSSFEDGYLAGFVYHTDDVSLGLKSKAEQRLSIAGHPYKMIHFNELFPKDAPSKKFSSLYPQSNGNVLKYACSDAICTELLCEKDDVEWLIVGNPDKKYNNLIEPVTDKKFYSTYILEKQTAQAVRLLERSRTKVDKKEIELLLVEASEESETYGNRIKMVAAGRGFHNFNPGSPNQLSDFLFGPDGLDLPNKPDKLEKSGLYKTSADVLEKLAEDPEAPQILLDIVKYRQIGKVIGTYLVSMSNNTDEFDQLRFNFNQAGAATGRFAAPQGDPDQGYAGVPIHGIPAKEDPKRPKVANSLRRLFVARPGYTMIKIDYAGQELRVVTNVSKEPLWMKAFLEGDGDLHLLTARAFYGSQVQKHDKKERNAGKMANFSLIYGGGVRAIQRATKCDTVEAARKKKSFDASVPIFAKWVKGQHAFVKKHLGVYNGFGRFIRIPDANVKVGDRDSYGGIVADEKMARMIQASCERKSTNYPIQGSGADILKIVLVRLTKELYKLGWIKMFGKGDDSVRMLMTVHDEIVFEVRDDRVPEALPVLISVMESPSQMVRWPVPLIVEPLLGKGWDAKYDWLEIQAGKQSLPEWLVPYFEGKSFGVPDSSKGSQPAESVPQPAESVPPPPVESVPQPAESVPLPPVESVPLPPPPAETRHHNKNDVAVFALSKSFLTKNTIKPFLKALVGAIPIGDISSNGYVKLRVVDSEGNTLLDTNSGVMVNPEALKMGLQEYNLGSGVYTVVEDL